MAKKTEVYVDTGAFIAFLDKSDSYHRLFAQLFSDPPLLLTTTLVITEGHAWFLKRYDPLRALQFLNFLKDLPRLKIHSIGKEEVERGTHVLRRYSDQTLTLVDAVGLQLMEQLKVKICWGTDRHLKLGGKRLVIEMM